MRSLNRPKNGFSIVAVLVAATLLSFLAIAFSKYLDNAIKGQKFVQNAVDFDILKTSINMVLNTRACESAFQDSAGNSLAVNFDPTVSPGTNVISTPVPIGKLVLGSSPVVSLDSPNLGGGLTLTNLELTDAIYDGDHHQGGISYKAFVATLKVTVKKSAKSLGARPEMSQSFSARLLLAPTATGGSIEKCGTSSVQKKKMLTWTTPGDHGLNVPVNYEALVPQGAQTEGSIIMVAGSGRYEDRLDFLFDPETNIITYTRTGYHCHKVGSANIQDTDVVVVSNFDSCVYPEANNFYARYVVRYETATQKLKMTMTRETYGDGPTTIRLLMNK